jgi:hypothetical protein
MTSTEPTKIVSFILTANDCQELSGRLAKEGIPHEIRQSAGPQNILGFDAQAVQNLILAIGSTGFVAAVAKILVAYLKERKKGIAIRKDDAGLQIVASNYDADDIERILQSLNKSETIVIVNRQIEITAVSEILSRKR